MPRTETSGPPPVLGTSPPRFSPPPVPGASTFAPTPTPAAGANGEAAIPTLATVASFASSERHTGTMAPARIPPPTFSETNNARAEDERRRSKPVDRWLPNQATRLRSEGPATTTAKGVAGRKASPFRLFCVSVDSSQNVLTAAEAKVHFKAAPLPVSCVKDEQLNNLQRFEDLLSAVSGPPKSSSSHGKSEPSSSSGACQLWQDGANVPSAAAAERRPCAAEEEVAEKKSRGFTGDASKVAHNVHKSRKALHCYDNPCPFPVATQQLRVPSHARLIPRFKPASPDLGGKCVSACPPPRPRDGAHSPEAVVPCAGTKRMAAKARGEFEVRRAQLELQRLAQQQLWHSTVEPPTKAASGRTSPARIAGWGEPARS